VERHGEDPLHHLGDDVADDGCLHACERLDRQHVAGQPGADEVGGDDAARCSGRSNPAVRTIGTSTWVVTNWLSRVRDST
jgi:hypothetical protein